MRNPIFGGTMKRLHGGSITTNTNSASYDTLNQEYVAILFTFGATTGTSATATIKLQDSADDSSFSDVTGATTAAITLDSGGASNDNVAFSIQSDRLRRYIRLVVTVAGTTPVTGATTTCVAVGGVPSVSIVPATAYDYVVEYA